MELLQAIRHTFNPDAKNVDLYAIAGYTQDGTLLVTFTPTVAKVDVEITRGTATGVIECALNEPLRPVKTEIGSVEEVAVASNFTFSASYENAVERVKLFELNNKSGEMVLHKGTTELTGYVSVYR